ncbi:MAG TPA: ATP-binding protein [Solirubrobacteraceae bacterium]|jgi:anti-sigma regulatory factor (Ser/Thr protein kinase)|nr:ATP-binding protein [Solirubrobacteraceae bacterium]
MAESPNVRLHLSNRSENVLLVREMLSGFAESVALENSDLYDIRTAVTEAANNVVLHAYEGREGPMEVELHTTPDTVQVVVRDSGVGIRPRIRPADEAALGIGLPLIQALVHSVEFSEANGSGTEVRMEFLAGCERPLAPPEPEHTDTHPLAVDDPASTIAVTVSPATLARAVLPRILSVLAARAHFSTDRISDAQLVADSLAAHAPESLGADRLSLTARVEGRTLELCVGPLGAGRADRLVMDSDVQGLGPVIEKLTDERRVATVGSSEMLALQLVDRA